MRWFDACWFLLLCGHLFNKQQNNGVEKVAIFCSFWITELEKWVEVSEFWPVHGPHASWQRRVYNLKISWVHASEIARSHSLGLEDLMCLRRACQCEMRSIYYFQTNIRSYFRMLDCYCSPRASWADAALPVWFCKLTYLGVVPVLVWSHFII